MHVIVTGGSSGIGLAVAKAYASKGDRVSLIARDPLRLNMALDEVKTLSKNSSAFVVSADVSVHEALTSAVKACEAANGPCDLLVACAGIVEPAAFDALPPALFEQQIATNLLGTANAIRSVLGGMRARGRGTIMVVSSGAALIGIHGYAAYCASKSALTGLVEALQAELADTGVRLSICFPPDTVTPQYLREMTMRPWQAEVLMGKVKPWSVEAVAGRIVAGIAKRRSTIYFTPSLMALAYFGPLIKPILSIWYRFQLGKSERLAGGIPPAATGLKTRLPPDVDSPKF